MLTSRITEGENHKLEATVMAISVCFSRALDPYFTLNFVCLLLFICNSQMNKEKRDLIVWVMLWHNHAVI